MEADVVRVTSKSDKNSLPSDSEVIGAVNRNVTKDTIVIGALALCYSDSTNCGSLVMLKDTIWSMDFLVWVMKYQLQ